MWFRKDLVEEIAEFIRALGVKEITINSEWQWQTKRMKNLLNLEELDLKIIRDIQLLHKYNRDNPALSERIILLATEFKRQLENLIQLSKLSTNIPPEKIDLAKKILRELRFLLSEELKEQRLIPGMTLEQAQKLGIRVKSFYSVQSDRGVRLLFHGKGDWPLSPTKAHLGPGLYMWDNLESAQRYRQNIINNLETNDEPVRPLYIVRVTFSESSIKKFQPFDVDLLDNFRTQGAQDWMERHSKLWTTNAKKHNSLYIIRGVSKDLGKEHYFRPECLQEAAVELVA